MRHYRASTTYFLTEGRSNLADCVRLSVRQAQRAGLEKIVMFTANGEGLELACKEIEGINDSTPLRLIGVSFAYGSVKREALDIPERRRRLFERLDIPIIHAADPLADLQHPKRDLVRGAMEFLSGGTALCIRATVIACDAGLVEPAEHIIAMSADTSIILKAAPLSHVFSTLSIREIICKPLVQNITKGENLATEVNVEVLLQRKRPKTLPATTTEPGQTRVPSPENAE